MKSLDEVIDRLLFSTKAMISEDNSMIVDLDDLAYAVRYLREYKTLLEKPRSERLMDILREVRGEK